MAGRVKRLDPFVPTPIDVVKKIVDFAELSEGKVLLDLGSGDGRIPITASLMTGCIALGVEINKELVRLANKKLKEKPYNVFIINEDMRRLDLSPVDVVTAYLSRKALTAMKPLFCNLKKDAIILTHDYLIPGWRPIEVLEAWSSHDSRVHRIYKYKPSLSNVTNSNCACIKRSRLVKLDQIIKQIKEDRNSS
ncbi:MAG: methyltransferase domain-containing protein [Nitrososphaerota archaeon]